MILRSRELSVTKILIRTFPEVDLQFPNKVIGVVNASSHELQAEYTLQALRCQGCSVNKRSQEAPYLTMLGFVFCFCFFRQLPLFRLPGVTHLQLAM